MRRGRPCGRPGAIELGFWGVPENPGKNRKNRKKSKKSTGMGITIYPKNCKDQILSTLYSNVQQNTFRKNEVIRMDHDIS